MFPPIIQPSATPPAWSISFATGITRINGYTLQHQTYNLYWVGDPLSPADDDAVIVFGVTRPFPFQNETFTLLRKDINGGAYANIGALRTAWEAALAI